jgi:hypothetical protein
MGSGMMSPITYTQLSHTQKKLASFNGKGSSDSVII